METLRNIWYTLYTAKVEELAGKAFNVLFILLALAFVYWLIGVDGMYAVGGDGSQ